MTSRLLEADTTSYNRRVRILMALLCVSPLLMGGACEKKGSTAPDNGGMTTPSNTGGSGGSTGTGIAPMPEGQVDTTPLPGVKLKLEGDREKLFYKLIASLSSPCGKAQSLRASFQSDTSCRRAPYAIRYVQMMLEDDGPEDEVIKFYNAKYKPVPPAQPLKLDVSKAPHMGADDAPVRMVEFFDYGCPHCQAFKPMMEQVLADEAGKVVTYYMMFPIESKHPDSRSAAQAVLAANQQGKFKDMHDALFAKSPAHNHDAVSGYAKDIGLDMGKFEHDYDAAGAQVSNDEKQAETAGVDSTPTIFFNDRKYEGPIAVKYIEAWIEEELAVNR